jgi:hypothetical protein
MDKNTSPNAADSSQADNSGSTPGQEPNDTANSSSQADTRTPDELLAEIRALRAENASRRKKERDTAEAAQQAEAARLAEKGQFKELAAQHEAHVKELEPQAQELAELTF